MVLAAEPPVVSAGGAGSLATSCCISSASTMTMPPFSPRMCARKLSGTGATMSMIGAPTPMRSKEEAEADMIKLTRHRDARGEEEFIVDLDDDAVFAGG